QSAFQARQAPNRAASRRRPLSSHRRRKRSDKARKAPHWCWIWGICPRRHGQKAYTTPAIMEASGSPVTSRASAQAATAERNIPSRKTKLYADRVETPKTYSGKAKTEAPSRFSEKARA